MDVDFKSFQNCRGLLENFHMVLTLDIGQRSQLNYWSIIVFPDPESLRRKKLIRRSGYGVMDIPSVEEGEMITPA